MKLRGTKFVRAPRNAMLAVSEFGVRHDLPWLAYNPALFAYYHFLARENAPAVASAICDEFPDVRTAIDVGAGTGAFAAELKRRGLRVQAWEHSRVGRWFAAAQGVSTMPLNLDTGLLPAGNFDLAYCFEVAEHVPENLADGLVSFVASTAPVVIFTAAPPGQGGTGHINEQPRSYWIEKFGRADRRYDAQMTARLASGFDRARHKWLRDNVMVFSGS